MAKETAPGSGPALQDGDPANSAQIPGEIEQNTQAPPTSEASALPSRAGGHQEVQDVSAPDALASGNGRLYATAPLDGTDSDGSADELLDAMQSPVSGAPGSHTTAQLSAMPRSRRRLLLRLAAALLALVLLVESFYLSPLTDASANQPPRKPSPVPLAEVQPYGVNTFLHKEVDLWKRDKTLQMSQDMGVGWIRQQFPWAEMEYRQDPQRPFWDVKNNQSAWDKFDNIVDLAQQHGLRIIARIDSAPGWSHPEWTTPKDPNLKAPPSPAHIQDFANFIKTFITRYRGRVAAIQVWNEPNLKGEWTAGKPGNSPPVNAAQYVQLLKAAYTAAKSADPNIIVLAAPLATNNETLAFAGNLNELDYLQQMYDAGARQYFDVMSANAYGKTEPPESAPSREKLNFRRVELLHDVMVHNGDANKSVWFNEYGWNASPSDMPEDKLPWGRVSPEQQADYTVRGIKYARDNWPWAGVFTIWYIRQVGDIPTSSSEYYFGLVNPDYVVTPAYRAVQDAATHYEKVATPGVWGPLSPPVQADPDWKVQLDPSLPGGVAVAASVVSDTLDVPFTGTDVKLTVVASADSVVTGTTQLPDRYYVTVDGKSDGVAAELPRDTFGSAYLPSPGPNRSIDVTVVRGLGSEFRTGTHHLLIRADRQTASPQSSGAGMGGRTYAPESSGVDLPSIGTITVEAERSYVLFIVLTLLLIAGILFSLWALRTDGRPRLAER